MAVGLQDMGRRLRTARESCGLTQEDVARRLGVSRPTVAQIELGNRAVTTIELDKLAYLFGRDIQEFLAEDFEEEDALAVLFRAEPEIAHHEDIADRLRSCIALGREVTNLEVLLGIDRELAGAVSYEVSAPRSRWDAIQQGERAAGDQHLEGLLDDGAVAAAQVLGRVRLEADAGHDVDREIDQVQQVGLDQRELVSAEVLPPSGNVQESGNTLNCTPEPGKLAHPGSAPR